MLVQIGAFDGQFNDPVIEQMQSKPNLALPIEPVPANFAALQANYASCPHVHLVQAALSNDTRLRKFYAVRRSGRWADSFHASQLGSFNREHLVNHGLPPEEIEESKIPCVTFVTLLGRNGLENVGFLLSDTEDYDAMVLQLAPKQDAGRNSSNKSSHELFTDYIQHWNA